MTKSIEKYLRGLILCLIIATISQYIGKKVPLVGPAVFAILIGMALGQVIKEKKAYMAGVRYFKENPSICGNPPRIWS